MLKSLKNIFKPYSMCRTDIYSLLIACKQYDTQTALTILAEPYIDLEDQKYGQEQEQEQEQDDNYKYMINIVNHEGFTSLHYACINNMTLVGSILVDKMEYSTLEQINIYGEDSLILACKYNMINVALKIIYKVYKYVEDNKENKYNIFNHIDNNGYSALYWACLYKQIDIINLILPCVNVEIIENYYDNDCTLLTIACYNNLDDIANQMIKKMSDEMINIGDKPALYYAYHNKMNKTVSVLEEKMSSYLLNDNYGIYYACKYKFEKIALQIVENEQYSNLFVEKIYTIQKKHNAYYYASKYKMNAILSKFENILREHSNKMDNKLLFACKYRLTFLIDEIIADPTFISYDETDKIYNRTALQFACINESEIIFNKIISKTKNFDNIDLFGNTALIYSCLKKLDKIANQLMLLTSNKLLNHKNNGKYDALRIASANNMIDVINKFIIIKSN